MITDYRNKHLHKKCYILGNGPSLNDVDLNKLGSVTFGSNRIYLSGFEPTYYACVNPLVIEQFGDEIAKMNSIKFMPKQYADKFGAIPIDTSLDVPRFGSPEWPIWEGHTVTYVLLQLAHYMGFGRAVLLGVDHDYGDVREPNAELTASGPDKHHFHPDYFSNGAQWNAPDLARSELAYSLAKGAWEAEGRLIYNGSSHTKLTIFPFIEEGLGRVSAIVSAFNAEDFIDGCLVDQAQQSIFHETVVVCEQGSPEHECAVEHRDAGENVSIVCVSGLPTVYEAWNLGIAASKGKYLTNANTDDRHDPRAYEIMANVLDARPEIDLVYHDSFVTWNKPATFDQFLDDLQRSGEPLVLGRVRDRPGAFAWPDHSMKIIGKGCYIGPHPMWRRSLHQRHGVFNASYKSAGDYEFWLRCAEPDNYFHIAAFLGVYCARMSGIELSDPVTAEMEFKQALMVHQDPDGVSYTPDGEHLRIDLGGSWVYANAEEAVKGIVKQFGVPTV